MFLNKIAPMGVKIRDDISCRILSNWEEATFYGLGGVLGKNLSFLNEGILIYHLYFRTLFRLQLRETEVLVRPSAWEIPIQF